MGPYIDDCVIQSAVAVAASIATWDQFLFVVEEHSEAGAIAESTSLAIYYWIHPPAGTWHVVILV